MMKRHKVTVERFFEEHSSELGLTLVEGHKWLRHRIPESTVNRPGLLLAGCRKYFAEHRVQVMGNAEIHYLKKLPDQERAERYALFFSCRIPCVVLCRGFRPPPELLAAAQKARVPVFLSPLVTMTFINRATIALEALFAPYDEVHGSMVDIGGIGVIIRGDPGVGKSECALELIGRGYSLVSDDITRLTINEEKELIGSSPPIGQNFMEVRGIGIVNVFEMFGIKAIRTNKRVDLVVTLKHWNDVEEVDRVGLDPENIDLLGIEVRHKIVPVAPGRDIARLVEVAAFQMKLDLIGLNSAREFEDRVLARNLNPNQAESGREKP